MIWPWLSLSHQVAALHRHVLSEQGQPKYKAWEYSLIKAGRNYRIGLAWVIVALMSHYMNIS